MINSQPLVSNEPIKSDFQKLTEQFIGGEFFSLELSDFVFSNISLSSKYNYTEYVSQVKQILSCSEIDHYYDLLIIKSSAKITEEQKVVLVRLINLCIARKTKIIIFNNSIIYIPDSLKKYQEDVVHAYINSMYRSYINREKINHIANKFKLKKLISFLYQY